MTMRRLLAVAVLLCAAWPVLAETPDSALGLDERILAISKDKPELISNLTYLSDIIGPRLTGSAALKRANDWTAEKMRSYGLENVRLEPYEIPVGWVRGTASARIVEPDNGRQLTVASAAWTPGTHGKVTGDVVIFRVTKREELAQFKGKLKNAIILRGPPANVAPITDLSYGAGQRRNPMGNPMGGNPPPKDRPEGGTPPARGNFEQQRQLQQEIRDFLKAEGAAAFMQDSGKPHGLLVTGGSWRGSERATPQDAVPSLFVAHEHYQLLYRLAQRKDAKTRVEIEVTNSFVPGPVTVYNTVGEIRGSEKPDEFVVLGAHLDSWDLGQGTTDNGTGSSVVLESARVLAKSGVMPKRTIRFVLFSGEEQGLHGSRAYVARHKDELPKTSLAIVHDTGTGKVQAICTSGREVLKPLLEKELPFLKSLGVEVSTATMGGSDHQSFETAGVPGFMFKQDWAEYRLTHHTQTDTLDKAKEADLIQGAQVMALTAMRVANRDGLLPRDKPPGRRPGGGEPKKDEPKKDDKKDDKKDK